MVPSLPVRLYAGSTQRVTALCRSTGNFTAGRNRAGFIKALVASAERPIRWRRCCEIAIADESNSVLGDSMPDCGADQCRQLFGMAVAGHRGDERRAAPGRRMKIHLADPFRQVWDQPEDPLLHHGAAPGEAKDVVVGAQIGSPQAAAQRLDPELI